MLQSHTHRLEEEEGTEGQDEYMKGRRRFRRKMNGMWSEHRQGMSNYEPCLEIGRYTSRELKWPVQFLVQNNVAFQNRKTSTTRRYLKILNQEKKYVKKRAKKNREDNTVAYPQSAMTSLSRP